MGVAYLSRKRQIGSIADIQVHNVHGNALSVESLALVNYQHNRL
jgi:uncharacterized protein with ACT and thioredoxin-like domain